MRRRRFLEVAGATGLGTIAGCMGSTSGGGPIVVGGMEPLSGPFTVWGKSHETGFNFALEEINEDGVLGGREIEFVTEDTEGDAGQADSVFRRLVEQEDAVTVTGAVSSDVGIRTSRTAEELGIPNLFHMAGSNECIGPDTTHSFRVGLHPATNIARSMGRLVGDQGFTKVGSIIADYSWGRSFQTAVDETFPTDVQTEVAPPGASDFKSQLRRFPDDLEMFMATGHPIGLVTIIKQLYDLGYDPEVITGAGTPVSLMIDALGDLLTRGFAALHMQDLTGEFPDIAARYAEANSKYMGPNDVYGYVTAHVLAEAIENAGSAEPADIRDALMNNSYETLYPQPLEWTDHGEFKGQSQVFSRIELESPEFYSGGDFRLNQFFTTDPLPALAPEA